MGAFNELYHAFETVARRNDQIFNDAADSGFPYDSKNPPAAIKMLIAEINDLQKNASEMIKSRSTFPNGVTIVIRVPVEHDAGVEVGYEYTVTFAKTSRHYSRIDKTCNAFIDVQITNYTKEL